MMANRSLSYALALALLVGTLSGCTGVEEARRIELYPACRSAVEGVYHAQLQYLGRAPALVLKKGTATDRFLPGVVLAMGRDSLLFDQDRVGPLYDPGPKLYPLDQVECVVDSAHVATYGTLPAEKSGTWDLEIVWRSNEDTTSFLGFVLHAGQPFSYCVPPGTYKAVAISFLQEGEISRGVLLPTLELTVAPKVSNLVGELRLDLDSGDVAGVCAIPYKVEKSEMYLVPTPNSLVGALIVGVIAGLAEAATQERYGVQGGHRLRVAPDTSNYSTSKLPKQPSPLRLTPHPLLPNNSPAK